MLFPWKVSSSERSVSFFLGGGLFVCFKKACFDNPTSYVDGRMGLLPGIQAGGGSGVGCMQKEKGEKALKEGNEYEEASIRGRGGEDATKIVGKSTI